MYVCMYVYMHGCMYTCMDVCSTQCMYDVCMYVCMYVLRSIHVYMYVCDCQFVHYLSQLVVLHGQHAGLPDEGLHKKLVKKRVRCRPKRPDPLDAGHFQGRLVYVCMYVLMYVLMYVCML